MKEKWIAVGSVGKVNLAYAQCVRLRRGGKGEKPSVTIEMADGKTVYNGNIYESDADDLEYIEYSGTVIPANPGFFVVWYWYDDKAGNDGYNKDEITCWEMNTDGFHKGISLFGHSAEDNSAILCPDGTVVEPGNQRFLNIDDWVKERRGERDRAKKKSA